MVLTYLLKLLAGLALDRMTMALLYFKIDIS